MVRALLCCSTPCGVLTPIERAFGPREVKGGDMSPRGPFEMQVMGMRHQTVESPGSGDTPHSWNFIEAGIRRNFGVPLDVSLFTWCS